MPCPSTLGWLGQCHPSADLFAFALELRAPPMSRPLFPTAAPFASRDSITPRRPAIRHDLYS